MTLIEMTSLIAKAYVGNNSVSTSALPGIIQSIYDSLNALKPELLQPEIVTKPQLTPAQIKRSIKPDYLVCFEDGKRYKTLKRHLTYIGMTPDEYRHKWGLPHDYPMVPPNYASRRSEIAKEGGLGVVKDGKHPRRK